MLRNAAGALRRTRIPYARREGVLSCEVMADEIVPQLAFDCNNIATSRGAHAAFSTDYTGLR